MDCLTLEYLPAYLFWHPVREKSQVLFQTTKFRDEFKDLWYRMRLQMGKRQSLKTTRNA